ncbi:peptidylprolyl isomerase [Acidobacteriota bacterium]
MDFLPKYKTGTSHYLLGIGVLCLALTLMVCQKADKPQGPDPAESSQESSLKDPAKSDLIILEVAELTYSNAIFLHYLEITAGDDYLSLDPEALSRLYDDFVDERILLEGARSGGLELSDEEKHDYLDRLQRDLPSEEREAFLDDVQMRMFFDRLLQEKYAASLVQDMHVSSDEISEYYASNKRAFLRGDRFRVSQILLKTDHEAVEALQKVKDKDEDAFRRIAREVSIGAEAVRGGEMGVFEMGQLPIEMERIILALKEGDVSDVLESIYGFHIFRLDKKIEAQLMNEADAQSEIRIKILEERASQIVADRILELKQTLEWKSNTGNLTFPYQRNDNE